MVKPPAEELRRPAAAIPGGLGDPPAAVGLLAGFDDCVLRLPADRQRDGVAAANGLGRKRLGTCGRHRLGLSGRNAEGRVRQGLTSRTGQGHRRSKGRDPAHRSPPRRALKPVSSGHPPA